MHEFAFYCDALSSSMIHKPCSLVIDNKLLFHRLTQVVRLNRGDKLILFDQHIQVKALFAGCQGTHLLFNECVWQKTEPRHTTITFLLPLLKKDECQQAIYGLTEVGVEHIQLLITERIHRSWWTGGHDHDRLERISIAAAEQAKNFIIPTISSPAPLRTVLDQFTSHTDFFRYFFDQSGMPLKKWHETCLGAPTPAKIIATVGPEADFTNQEKELLRKAQFSLLKLTPTVLRAFQAATFGAAILRSFFS